MRPGLAAAPATAAALIDQLGLIPHPEGGFYSAEDADSVPPEHASDPRPHKINLSIGIYFDDASRATRSTSGSSA